MTPARVLVTGATGFVGAAVCRCLAAAGHEVHAIYRVDGRPPRRDLGAQAWHAHTGTDADMVRLVADAAPDVIVHLAAHAAGPAGDGDVTRLVASNLLLGTQLLAAAVAVGCPHLVNTGSYWEYYEGEQAVSLYAALKQGFARVVDYHCHAHGLRAITLALHDTYGPGDPRGKFLDLMIDAIRRGEPLDASDGHQSIDLTHVEDVARAYLVAVARVATLPAGTHETFGVGSGRATSLREIAAAAERELGTAGTVRWGVRPRSPRTFDAPPSLPRLPGWSPQVSLEAGLRDLLGRRADG